MSASLPGQEPTVTVLPIWLTAGAAGRKLSLASVGLGIFYLNYKVDEA